MARLGQHFLTDASYLERVVDAASVAVGDRVLEIGPGRGHLTRHLLDRGARVTAIELDRGLAYELDRSLGDRENLEILQGDAADMEWPDAHKLVANLPYQISSPTIGRFLEEDLEIAVLTLQRAFAERLVADPEDEEISRLTVNTQLRSEPELLFEIPKGAFQPPPDVRSACVRLKRIDGPSIEDPELFDRVLREAFTHKRKMLRSSLKEIEGAREALEEMDLAKTRPGRVAPERWVRLVEAVAEARAT